MDIGQKIRETRKQLGLSQNQVVESFNTLSKELSKNNSSNYKTITNGTLSNWETNTFSPDPDSIAILCKILNIDPNRLFGIDDLLKEEFIKEFGKLENKQKESIIDIIKTMNNSK